MRFWNAFFLTFLVSLFASQAAAAGKKEIIWDGFAYPLANMGDSTCNSALFPSCTVLLSEQYANQFAQKIKDIEDDDYVIVDRPDNDLGYNLHLAIVINLERCGEKDATQCTDNKYRLCSTVYLYETDAKIFSLVKARPFCIEKALDETQINEIYVQNFIAGKGKSGTRNLEDRWLAEISAITAKGSDLIRLEVTAVELADDIFSSNTNERERLKVYIAEKFTSELATALRRPIIPPSLSGTHKIELKFREVGLSRSITLPKSFHALKLTLLPFQKKITKDIGNYEFTNYFSIIKISHEGFSGSHHLNNIGFYTAIKQKSSLGDIGNESSWNFICLNELLTELAQQISAPDKKWVNQFIYKSDPDSALNGLKNLSKELGVR